MSFAGFNSRTSVKGRLQAALYWNRKTRLGRQEGLTQPGQPTAVSATAGDADAEVSFTAPVEDGGSTILGYRVTSIPGGLIGVGATSPITVPGLTNDVEYRFTVAAVNSMGTGQASALSNAVTPTEA